MAKKEVIADTYEIFRLDDIGEECDFTYKCPHCDKEIKGLEVIFYSDIYSNAHWFGVDTVCENCKGEVTVINPDPNKE